MPSSGLGRFDRLCVKQSRQRSHDTLGINCSAIINRSAPLIISSAGTFHYERSKGDHNDTPNAGYRSRSDAIPVENPDLFVFNLLSCKHVPNEEKGNHFGKVGEKHFKSQRRPDLSPMQSRPKYSIEKVAQGNNDSELCIARFNSQQASCPDASERL
jgi:hypothetical protein